MIALQQSFSSKALIVIPIIAFAIATLSGTQEVDEMASNWRVHCVFWGALIFLIGHAVLWKKRPIDFARDRDTEDAFPTIRYLSNAATFKGRVDLLKALITKYQAAPPLGLDQTELTVAKSRTSQPIDELAKKWEDNLPLIVTSHRRLIAYDDPKSRATVVFLLGSGAALMLTPTFYNVGVTAFTMLSMYAQGICTFAHQIVADFRATLAR